MPTNTGNEPAFPFDPQGTEPHAGMTLRDYFAAAALPACIAWQVKLGRDELLADGQAKHAQPSMPDSADDHDPSDVAEVAYIFADAMLKARKLNEGEVSP